VWSLNWCSRTFETNSSQSLSPSFNAAQVLLVSRSGFERGTLVHSDRECTALVTKGNRFFSGMASRRTPDTFRSRQVLPGRNDGGHAPETQQRA
jgi:hypothetical protein